MDVQDGRFSNNPNFLDAKIIYITYGVPQSALESSATWSIRISKKARLIYDNGVILLNASILKGTAFLLQSKKRYDRRLVKEVTFSKTEDKSGLLKHHQEIEIEIKLCITTNRRKKSFILHFYLLFMPKKKIVLTKPV